MIEYKKYKNEFIDILNEEGEYAIGTNFSRLPSDIILEMDEEAFQEQLIEYVENKKADYAQIVYDMFPAPIAYYFRQTEHGYENEHQRLHFLRDSWESLIYVLYALVLGEVNAKRFDLSEIRLFNNQRIKLDHNSLLGDKLGYRLETIKKIIEYDKDKDNILSISSIVTVESIIELKDLNSERNSFSHTSALTPQEAQDFFDDLYPKVLDMLFQFDFLENVSLLRYVNTQGTANKIRFSKFDGHSLQKDNYDKEFDASVFTEIVPILNNNNLLVQFEDTFFNVTPFVYYHIEGTQVKLCFFKKLDRDTDEFIFEIIGGAERETHISVDTLTTGINNTMGDLLS